MGSGRRSAVPQARLPRLGAGRALSQARDEEPDETGGSTRSEADGKPTKHISAPPLAPGEPVIDRAHLARMTLGDSRLEVEVLALFDRQATLLLARMTGAAPLAIAAFAHTLKGSARGIGMWRVAAAAEALEQAAQPVSLLTRS